MKADAAFKIAVLVEMHYTLPAIEQGVVYDAGAVTKG